MLSSASNEGTTTAPLAGATGGGNSSSNGGGTGGSGGAVGHESTTNMNESISIFKGAASVLEAMQQSMQQSSLAFQTSFVTGNQGSSTVSGLTAASTSISNSAASILDANSAYGVCLSSSFSVSTEVDPEVALHALRGGGTVEEQEGIWATSDKTYYDVLKAMKESIAIEDRMYLFTTYEQCWLGSEAVTFLQDYLQLNSRQQALEVGLAMNNAIHCWKHVCGDHELKDQYLFYEFTDYFVPQQRVSEPSEESSLHPDQLKKQQLVSQASWRQVHADKVQEMLSKNRQEKSKEQKFDPFGVLLDASASEQANGTDDNNNSNTAEKPLNQIFSDSFAFGGKDVQVASPEESDGDDSFFGDHRHGDDESDKEDSNKKKKKKKTNIKSILGTTKSLLARPLPMSEACRSRSAPSSTTTNTTTKTMMSGTAASDDFFAILNNNNNNNNDAHIVANAVSSAAATGASTADFVNAATTVATTAKNIRARTNRSRSRTRSVSPIGSRTSTRMSTMSYRTESGSPPTVADRVRRRTVSPNWEQEEEQQQQELEAATASATAAAEALHLNTTASRRSTHASNRISARTSSSSARISSSSARTSLANSRVSTRTSSSSSDHMRTSMASTRTSTTTTRTSSCSDMRTSWASRSRSPSSNNLTIAKQGSKRVMSPVPMSPKQQSDAAAARRSRVMSSKRMDPLGGPNSDHGAPFSLANHHQKNQNPDPFRRASSAVVPRNTTELFPPAPLEKPRGLPGRTVSTGSRGSSRASVASSQSSNKKRFSSSVSPQSVGRRTRSTSSARTGTCVVPTNLDDDDDDDEVSIDEEDADVSSKRNGRGRSPPQQLPGASEFDGEEEFASKRTRSKSDTGYLKRSSSFGGGALATSRYSSITMPSSSTTTRASAVTVNKKFGKSGDLLSSSDHGVSRYASIVNSTKATTKAPPAVTPKADRRKIKSGDLLSSSDHGVLRKTSSFSVPSRNSKRSVSPVSPKPESGGRRGRFVKTKSGVLLSSSDHVVTKKTTRSMSPRRPQSSSSTSPARSASGKIRRTASSVSPSSGSRAVEERTLPRRTNSDNGKRTTSPSDADSKKKKKSSSRGRSPRRQVGSYQPLSDDGAGENNTAWMRKRSHSDTTWIRNKGPLTPIPEKKRVGRRGPSSSSLRQSKSPSRQRSSNAINSSKNRISKSSSPKGYRSRSRERRRSPTDERSAAKISLSTKEEESSDLSLDISKASTSDELGASSMHSYLHTMTRPQRAIAKELESIGIKFPKVNVKKLKKKLKKSKDKDKMDDQSTPTDSESSERMTSERMRLKTMTKKAVESIGNKTQSFTALADFTKDALKTKPKVPSRFNSLPDFNGIVAPVSKLTDSAVSKANATWKSTKRTATEPMAKLRDSANATWKNTTKRNGSEPLPSLLGSEENHRTALLGGSGSSSSPKRGGGGGVSASLTPLSDNPLGLNIRLRPSSAQNLRALLNNSEQ